MDLLIALLVFFILFAYVAVCNAWTGDRKDSRLAAGLAAVVGVSGVIALVVLRDTL